MDDSTHEIDFITDNPCYGCRFSVKRDISKIDNYFENRFGCINESRRDRLINYVRKLLDSDNPNIGKCLYNLEEVCYMDRFKRENGCFPCEEVAVGNPVCYEKTTNETEVEAGND